MKKISIQFQDQFGYWKHLRTSHHEPTAFREASNRAKSTNKRHRLVDSSNNILDILEP
mgnify:FL=1|jgi:hypothetical protein